MDFHPVSERIERLLRAAGVWYERYDHEPVRTSQEAARARPEYSIRQGTKALIVSGKKGGKKETFMVVVPGHLTFDRKKLQDATGFRDVRFVTEEEVRDLTDGVEPGGVPPWGGLFGLPLYADERVLANERIVFNAGDRRVSLAMRSDDYARLSGATFADIAREPEEQRCITPLAS